MLAARHPVPSIATVRAAALAVLAVLPACGQMETEQQSREALFKAAVPSHAQVGIQVPGRESVTTPKLSEVALDWDRMPGRGALGALEVLGQRAPFYTLTHDVSQAVNGGVLGLLVVIKAIADSPPSVVTDTHRYYGPWTGALEPLSYAFVMDVENQEDIRYALMARPKASTSDDDWRAVIGGTYHPIAEGRGEGTLGVDADAIAALDPAGDHGQGRILVRWSNAAEPRTVEVAFDGFADKKADIPGNALYRYREAADTSGTFEFLVHGDLDDGKNPAKLAKETIGIVSRWTAGGAGRSDVTIAGGDLGLIKVGMTECWSDDFGRVYYSDDKGIHPTEGDSADCVF